MHAAHLVTSTEITIHERTVDTTVRLEAKIVRYCGDRVEVVGIFCSTDALMPRIYSPFWVLWLFVCQFNICQLDVFVGALTTIRLARFWKVFATSLRERWTLSLGGPGKRPHMLGWILAGTMNRRKQKVKTPCQGNLLDWRPKRCSMALRMCFSSTRSTLYTINGWMGSGLAT